MLKVMTVVGTRPELIKLMPVLLALRARRDFRVSLVSTGQHREMSDHVYAAFGAAPDIAASISAFTTRPFGPLPFSAARSIPACAAMRRASGEANTRSPLS